MAQTTTMVKGFVPAFRRRAKARAGSWLMAGYRFCVTLLIVVFVSSIDRAFKGTLDRRTAFGFLSTLAFSVLEICLLVAVGRRRGETYWGDSLAFTRVAVCALSATVLALCSHALKVF